MHRRDAASALASEGVHDVAPGSRVGVVLLGPGGPQGRAEIRPYLYRLLMDPAGEALPGSGWMRHLTSRAVSVMRGTALEHEYEAVGGRAPVVRHALEQVRSLQTTLARTDDPVAWRVYPAMRYGQPSTEEALERLADDGIDHAVLVPIFPQFSSARTGSSLLYWEAVATRARRTVAVSAIRDYAEDPLLVRAFHERIEETLQRFPRDRRNGVRFVFVAQAGAPADDRRQDRPYCCQVHRTVDAVMRLRGFDRPFEVAFQRAPGVADPGRDSLEDVLSRVGDEGARDLLLLPVSTVTEQLDIAFRLDVAMRSVADSAGIARYEVAAPLNCHPLLIEGLARLVRSRVAVDGTRLAAGPAPGSTVCPRAAWEASGDSMAVCRHCRRSAPMHTLAPRPTSVQAEK